MPNADATSEPVELSVVVLAWNQLALTKRCVDSIRSSTDVRYELIIVDNGSGAAAASWATEAADQAILHDANLGFAKGMNAGLAAANGPTVAFVNNDTVMPPRWASPLLETLTTERNHTGIVVPAVTNAGNASTVRSEARDSVHATRPFRDLPSGVVYVVSTAMMKHLGGWSERYPIASAEDLELLFTIWSNGLEVVLDERVLVDHVGGATAETQLANKGRIWRENRQIFVSRWLAISEDDVPVLPGVDAGVRKARLAQARVAAWWMKRAFDADDAMAAALAQNRELLDGAVRDRTTQEQPEARDTEKPLNARVWDLLHRRTGRNG